MGDQQTVINVDKIMEDIRAQIKKQGLDKEILTFEQIGCPSEETASDVFEQDALDCNVDGMNRSYSIQANRPVYGNPLTCFIKKAMRKLIQFYVLPVAEDQTAFNVFAVRSMNSIRAHIIEQRAKNQEIEELKKRVAELEKMLCEGK